MPKQTNNNANQGQSGKNGKSFSRRPLASDKTMQEIEKQIKEEVKEEEIDEGLSRIYEDEKGKIINVKKIAFKRGRGIIFRFFSFLFTLAILAGLGYGAYYLYLQKGSDATDIEFSLNSKDKVAAGEEFFYTVKYRNLSNVNLQNAEIKLIYPENFIFLNSEPRGESESSLKIGEIGAHRSGEIKIKGKIVGLAGQRAIAFAEIIYTPVNFSSQFKKEASSEISIQDIGLNFNINSPASALAGEENTIFIKYAFKKENFINKFILSIEPLGNIEFTSPTSTENGILSASRIIRTGAWEINKIPAISSLPGAATSEEGELDIKFKFRNKEKPQENLNIKAEYTEDGQKYYKFFEKTLFFEVVKNNLNLGLILNGSRADQGVEFGQTLNYTIVYANKGEAEMKDIVIMAVLDSDLLDWDSLEDKNKGQLETRALSWSKEEIPALASIKSGDENLIDFSIKLLPLEKAQAANLDPRQYQIKSFVQFSIGTSTPIKNSEDAKSNTITCKINSDLKLKEEVRYFDLDNIAVGSGPLPPQAGQATSFKVYWKITNNLHELNNVKIQTKLPNYIKWDNKNRATVGSIQFDSSSNSVVWDVGKMPISVYEATAEFSIALTPAETDKNKILVLLSGTEVSAIDSETSAEIKKIMKAETTKLDDDEIANTDGIIR
jgi:uncharacterized repeat protein (TIGR01451 family)